MITIQLQDDDAKKLLDNLSRAALPTDSPAARLREELKCGLALCECGEQKRRAE